MGSAPSTPNRESDNPWWQIETQILELNPNTMEASEDPNSSSNRSEPDQQEVHRDESEILISTANVECENNNDDTIDNATNSSASPASLTNENSENGVANVCSSESSESSANVENNSERAHSNERQQSLEEFKQELRIKREMRTNAIVELRNELCSLRQQLAHEKEINKQLIEERNKESLCEICNSIYNSLEQNDSAIECVAVVKDGGDDAAERNQTSNNTTLRTHLAEVQFSLQNANAEILRISSELAATRQQAKSLKEVIAVSKEIIEIRETELSQLKSKLKDIENSLAEHELHMMSESLRQEYDRQLVNIRNLRALYEERARISAAEKENLNRQLETSRAELTAAVEKNKNLEEHIESLNGDLKSNSIDLYATKEKLAYYQAESKNLYDEMTVVNQLFGQLLAGFNGNNNIDIDKLTAMLEENRDLLNDITSKEDCKEGAAQIPKLIFDLVSQADKKSDDAENVDGSPGTSADECVDVGGGGGATVTGTVTSAQEIIHNLPKVWRVLIELLNHQQLKPVPLQQELCYKSIQTETGKTEMVLSVSKTFIRLKDLIMEKKFLQKETKKLKNLNSHLECRLGEQEQRLSAVTIELNKTWNLVGRMQRQHRQLHTHEQVLRYQLQQKRRMLSELKDELEYCRRKWALAKEKNNESQCQWESLRLEFIQRKESDLNNSGESGYSDSPASEEDDDDDDVASVSIISTESSRNSRMKKKINIETFLRAHEPVDRKTLRIHSVSPVRTARMNVGRRNSDSQITTQFATEVFQVSSDVVEPLVHVCTDCGENCIKHSVHFESDAAVDRPAATEQAQVNEPIVCGAVKPKLTNAQKLVEAKVSTSKKKMCCELRKTDAIAKPTKSTTAKVEESLEEMFLRLSGSKGPECENSELNNRSSIETESAPTAEDDRAAQKLAQIERLEDQCKQLMTQVVRASNRGDELNKRADTAHNKFKLNCNLLPSLKNNTDLDGPKPSTSGQQKTKIQSSSKTDEKCLTKTEQEYLARRDERLKRLEAESQAHLNRMKSMQQRTASVDTKLDSLRKRATDAKLSIAKVEAKFNAIAANISLPCTLNELLNQATSQTNEQNRPEPHETEMNDIAPPQEERLDAVHLEPSSSSKTDDQFLTVTEREYVASREARLKRLEAEAQAYMDLVKSTNRRSVDVDTKLEFLHGRYDSESDVAGTAAQPTPTDNVVNEPQTVISEFVSTTANSDADDIPSNGPNVPLNQQSENETDHSLSETIPNTVDDDINENTSD